VYLILYIYVCVCPIDIKTYSLLLFEFLQLSVKVLLNEQIKSDKRVLYVSEYDIGWVHDWEYRVYSLKFVFYYSKPLVIWAEVPISNPPQGHALNFSAFKI